MPETRACPRCDEAIPADSAACPACGELFESAACERHPDRAAVGACVICGAPVCDECDDVAGKAHRCPDHCAIPVVEGWAQVYTTSDDVQAQLVEENLRSDGIEARVFSQKDHYAFAVQIGNLSPVRVLVPAFDYQRASDVIRQHMLGDGDVAFACPECGEAYEPGAERCVACNAALV